MQVFEEVKRNQLVTEVDIQTQVALDDYQVQFQDIDNPTQSQDNVVIDRHGEFLPHWNESSDFDTWVKMSMEIAGKRLLILQGNSNVSSASNGSDTFVVFDDFGDASLDPQWTYAEGATPATDDYSESGGVLQITSAETDHPWIGNRLGEVPRVYTSISDIDVEITTKITTGSLDVIYEGVGIYIAQDNDDWTSVVHLCSTHFGVNEAQREKQDAGVRTYSSINFTKTNPEYLKLTRLGNIFEYFVSADRITWTSFGTYTKTMTASSVGMYVFDNAIESFDDFRVRKYTATEPIWSADGGEQNIAVALKSFGRTG